MTTAIPADTLFPRLYRADVLACQITSAWYPTFENKMIKITIILDLGEDFRAYLESDGIVILDGAEDR